jgi:glycine cleavage system H protein
VASGNVPDDRLYTSEHEWIMPDGTVGITDFAQDALGDVVFVDLPEVGRRLEQGAVFGVVESVKSVSDLFSPVTGTVVAVNEALKEKPEVVNQDPYGAGWLVRVQADGAVEAGGPLLDAAGYRALDA